MITSSIMSVLTRSQNKGVMEVTGTKVNRGAGYGLEIPCVYRLYGTRAYIECLKTAVEQIERQRNFTVAHIAVRIIYYCTVRRMHCAVSAFRIIEVSVSQGC